MTTYAMTTAPDMTSDATFRAWGSAISSGMAAIGWVKVTDASQINWTTVTKPTLANTAAGYEIWGMNDALQSTAPFYLKIEYGSGNIAAAPGMWFTIGTAQNGSGTLTGNVGTRRQLQIGNGTTAYVHKFSGTSSRLTGGLWWGANNSSCMTAAFVERTHDATGADTAEGTISFFGNGYGNFFQSQYVPSIGTVPSAYTTSSLGCTAPSSGSGTLGANVYLYPCRVFGPGEMAPFLGCVGYFNSDVSTGSTVTVTTWAGSNKTMYLANGWTSFNYGGALAMGILYE